MPTDLTLHSAAIILTVTFMLWLVPRRMGRGAVDGVASSVIMHPIVEAFKRTAMTWTRSEDQATAQARVLAIELIENGLIPDGVVLHGMPLVKDK